MGSLANGCCTVEGERPCAGGWMRLLVAGLATLTLLGGCAALQKTEKLPPLLPEDTLEGGREGEGAYEYSIW